MNLGTQAGLFAGDKNWENGFKVTAGLLASSAAVLDVAGGGITALSFEEKANQIKRFGAWFAVGGATFGFIADTTALSKEYLGDKNGWLIALLASKLIPSLGMLAVSFGMLIQLPILRSTMIEIASKNALVSKLLLVNFIRGAAMFNWIGMGLTVLEIIFRNYYLDNELQKWCEKSIFGFEANKYKSLEEEENAFSKAIVSI